MNTVDSDVPRIFGNQNQSRGRASDRAESVSSWKLTNQPRTGQPINVTVGIAKSANPPNPWENRASNRT